MFVMQKKLPARPSLDHLRRQAKSLLAALETQDPEAVSLLLKHLPLAKGKTAEQILLSRYRLADAQWAIARKTGFASWPHLARHVEQLRALEGSWGFDRLEIDGEVFPAEASGNSRILIDGDRFRTETPEGIYEGLFNINVESDPHEIDIEFVAGPEAGNTNHGIYRLNQDRLEICLDLHGKPRPSAFRTAPRSGQAYEILTRTTRQRPEGVQGGQPPNPADPTPRSAEPEFAFTDSATLRRLQGTWKPIRMVRSGIELPAAMLRSGVRTAVKNEVTIALGGKVLIHALVRLDETKSPIQIDYFSLAKSDQGAIQLGIMKWVGDEVCFCMAMPGQPRPDEFGSALGSQFLLSQWRRDP